MINIIDVQVLNNPSPFGAPFQFEICYECFAPLKADLEWSLVYVGSSESRACDQILETIFLGPMVVGHYKFVFSAPPPNPTKIPKRDIVGVTVILLICKYKYQEFVRVGYFVNNAYDCEEFSQNPPDEVLLNRLTRTILSNEPRCTHRSITWDNLQEVDFAPPQEQMDFSMSEEDDEEGTPDETDSCESDDQDESRSL